MPQESSRPAPDCRSGGDGDVSAYARKGSQSVTKGSQMGQSETHSVNDIRTAIRELSLRAELARKEGRPDDAAELEARVAAYRQELAAKP